MAISQRTLIERISRFLRSIESRGIEPSRWEGHCLKLALEELNAGDIEAAEGHVYIAKMPPELRTSGMLVGFSPENRSPTLAELRADFERLAPKATAAAGESL